MKLWTWQSEGFSLAKDEKVKSLEKSPYCNENSPYAKNRNHRESYIKVFRRLRTCQVIWCFTNYKEAISCAQIESFENTRHCLLWELDIPENEIRWYCQVAWDALINGKARMLSEVFDIFNASEPNFQGLAKKYKIDFNSYWAGKGANHYLDLMFLKKPVLDLGLSNSPSQGCSGAIVIHPVGKERITKNPLEIGKWWNSSDSKLNLAPLNKDEKLVKMIPCRNCPGR